MSDEIVVREATAADIPEILRQRRGLFVEATPGELGKLDAMEKASEPYLKSAIADGSFRGWIAESRQGVALGGGAVVIYGYPASTVELQPRRAHILNIYTYPEHRRRGVARRVTEAMIEWCRREGFAKVTLRATDAGRPLYSQLGFKPGSEMALELRPRDTDGRS